MTACTVLLIAAPGALAGEVSGLLEPCQGDSCRDHLGDDRIRASDPDSDTVRCGPGNDHVFISRRGRVFGCERVTYGSDS